MGKPPAPGRPERGPGADAETHRGNAGGKPTISGQSRFSTPAAAVCGGARRLRSAVAYEVLEGVDGGKRQPHLARGDADHGGDLEQLEADGGALRLGHGRAGQAHLPHGVHQHAGKG